MSPNLGTEELNKRCERSITKMSNQEAFTHIGDLIDDGADVSSERAIKRGLYLLDELSKRDLVATDGALVEYFRANAWAAMSQISNARRSWTWESPEAQEEMLALSRASSHPGFQGLDEVRQCQILTNHANLLNWSVGQSMRSPDGTLLSRLFPALRSRSETEAAASRRTHV